MEDSEMYRDTYIIEFVKDDTKFICNRNSNEFDVIFKDKYVKFWEIKDIYDMRVSNCEQCKILTVLEGVHNYNKCHQKQINEIKKQYINGHVEADEKLANVQFANTFESYRTFYKKQYERFIQQIRHIGDTDELIDKLYNMANTLFYKSKNINYLLKSRWYIWNDERLSYEDRILIIILKDYIYNAKSNNYKYPFQKNKIISTIKMLINDIFLNKENSTKGYIENNKNDIHLKELANGLMELKGINIENFVKFLNGYCK